MDTELTSQRPNSRTQRAKRAVVLVAVVTVFNLVVGPFLGDEFEAWAPPDLNLSAGATVILWLLLLCGTLVMYAAQGRWSRRAAYTSLCLLIVIWCVGWAVTMASTYSTTKEILAQSGLVGLLGAWLLWRLALHPKHVRGSAP